VTLAPLGGVATPLRDFVGRLFQILGRDVRIVAVPRRLALVAGAVLERIAQATGGAEPPLTAYGAMILGWSQTFDLTAAREILRWTPRRDPLAALDWALRERAACAKS